MARLVGINHVALEVGDVEQALDWWGRFFDFDLRGKGPGMAFIDIGDQFVALARGDGGHVPDHVGIVVDDKEAVRAMALEAGLDVPRSGKLRLRDPWGNTLEIVDYRQVQFTKAPEVLSALGLDGLEKTDAAREELRAKGITA